MTIVLSMMTQKTQTTMAITQKRERIPALDFWRGAFLLMIYVNHVPDNMLAMLTLRNWGFADSAEIFVFISGFSAMLAFGKFFDFGGFGIGVLRIIKRTWQLFCAHVLLVFAMSAMIAIAAEFMDSKPIMEQLNFSPFFVETDVAIVKLLKLGYMPNLTDILPLYIVLIMFFPIVWLLMAVSPFLALAASFALWLWVNVTGNSFANYPEGAKWFFNPLAWQFLFVLGMAVYKERERARIWLKSSVLYAISVIVVVVSVFVIAPWTQFEVFSNWRLVSPSVLVVDDKSNLSWIRIVHFCALAFVAARLIPSASKFWKNRAVSYVSLCGRHSLIIYCTGSALALAMHILLRMTGLKSFDAAMVVFSGVVVLVAVAFALECAKTLMDQATKGYIQRQ